MQELDVLELDSVGGGSVDWGAIGTTIGLDSLAVGAAAASMPVVAFAAAAAGVGAIAFGIYNEFS